VPRDHKEKTSTPGEPNFIASDGLDQTPLALLLPLFASGVLALACGVLGASGDLPFPDGVLGKSDPFSLVASNAAFLGWVVSKAGLPVLFSGSGGCAAGE